jgi:RNA polymerase sigma-70 factor (ECF subfamily)
MALDHPDAGLVARIRNSDEAAFETVFHQLYPALVGYATRLLGDQPAAEDVVQTVFVELWERRSGFAPVSGVRPYLFSAVRYRARDRQRGDRRASRYTDQYGIDAERDGVDETAQEQLERAERAETVHAALDGLAPRAREALLLVRDHGLSYREAALVMGVSVNTVKTQLSRAIAILRTMIGPLLTVLISSSR